MATVTRSSLTTYSTMGCFGGEVIGTNNSGTAAQGNTNLNQSGGSLGIDFQPDKNLTNIIWNSSFRNAANWSATDGTSGGAGPGGSGNGPGTHGSGTNWTGFQSGGSTATATMAVDMANAATFSITAGGSGYSSPPSVSVRYDSTGDGSVDADVVWASGPTATLSGGAVNGISGSLITTIPFGRTTAVTIAGITHNVTGDEFEIVLNQGSSSITDSVYHAGIPIDGSNNTPVPTDFTTQGIQWSTGTIQEDIWVHIKFTVSGSGSSDPIHLKVGSSANATTWGTFAILPEQAYATRTVSSHAADQGVVYNSGGTYYWVGKVESVNSSEGSNIFFTLVSGGASGRSYTIKQVEAYVRNFISNPIITKTPTGTLTVGDTLSASLTDATTAIAGDFIDRSLARSDWDFEYNGSSHVSDGTANHSGSAMTLGYTYPASTTPDRYTIRVQTHLENTNAYYTLGSSYRMATDIEYVTLMPINSILQPFGSVAAARDNETVEADGSYVVSNLGIWENGEQTENPFFIYEKVQYRIETTEPISEFYIDWDDGEDNSPEKANYQTIKLEEPQFFAVCDHIYSTYGSHYPIIRAKNVNGFWSKYYTAYEDAGTERTTISSGIDASTTSVPVAARDNIANSDVIRIAGEYMQVTSGGGATGAGTLTVTRGYLNSDKLIHASSSKVYECTGVNQNDYKGIESIDVGSGQNTHSIISVDHISTHKLPVFRPANKPPIAILKTDRTRLLSGIQNELFSSSGEEAVKRVWVDATETGGGTKTGSDSARVKITYETIDTSGKDQQVLTTTLYDTQYIDNVAKILKVELVNLKEVDAATEQALQSGEKVKLRVSNTTGAIFCYVSLGNPIVSASDVANTAILDLSESKTRASNLSISEYYLDDGHHLLGSSRHNPVTTTIESNSADETGNVLSSAFKNYYSTLSSQYSFQEDSDPIGTDGRFLSREILCRGQVKDNSSTLRKNHAATSGDTISYSYLDHDEHLTYKNKGSAGSTPPRPSTLCSSHFMIGTTTRDTPNWVDLSDLNLSGAKSSGEFLLGGGHSSTTARTPGTSGDNAHTGKAENYILMTRKEKFDKIYIKTHNSYGANPPTMSGTTTIPEYRVTLYYPSKNNDGEVKWKPLPFTDTTKYENLADSSFMRDGSLIFRPPLDWHKGVSADIASYEFGASFAADSGSSSDVGPNDIWTTANGSSYGLMICIATKGNHSNVTKGGISYIKPYNNSHSQVLTLLDPTHVSLNSKTLAQGISFARKGKYNVLTSRLGKAEIRRISSDNGSVTFGSVDLPTDTTRKDMKEYQQASTPVYLDVAHENGDSTRFFGVIESMSETHATGKMTPKFGLKMIVSHIIEFNSSGTILSNGYISLGGNIDYESEYVQ